MTCASLHSRPLHETWMPVAIAIVTRLLAQKNSNGRFAGDRDFGSDRAADRHGRTKDNNGVRVDGDNYKAHPDADDKDR